MLREIRPTGRDREMRCVVTGGAGFIGSHVVDLLLAEGHSVAALDNVSTGHLENLSHHRDKPDLSVHQVDVCDYEGIRPLFDGVDWVFHFAALADIVPSIERPMEYMDRNVAGTVSVVEASRQSGVQRLVYAASSSCYGIPDVYPTPEASPIRCEYPYALSKYLGEQVVLHWNRVYDLPVVSLRFFNVYGPRSRTSGTYGAVFGIFLAQKLHGKPFTVVGDGTQTRDFVFVTDVARACLLAAESKLSGEVLNVGAGSPVSVSRLVELLGGDTVRVPKRPGEPDCTHADVSKIERVLGWQPAVPFEDGVDIMLRNISLWAEAPVWDVSGIERATAQWFAALK